MTSDFRRRVLNIISLGIPGLSALGSLAFLPNSVVSPTVAHAASAEVIIVDGSGAPVSDPLAAVTTSTQAPTAAQLKEYLNRPGPRPVQLHPRTNFKQWRRPRGLSSVARRRQNSRRKA